MHCVKYRVVYFIVHYNAILHMYIDDNVLITEVQPHKMQKQFNYKARQSLS